MDRIEGEMTAMARSAGFADLASFRASLKTNPKYIPTSAEQILDDYRHYTRADAAQAPAALHPAAQVAGDRRSHSRLPVGGRDALS